MLVFRARVGLPWSVRARKYLCARQVTKQACPTAQKIKVGLGSLFKDVIRKVRICRDAQLRQHLEDHVQEVRICLVAFVVVNIASRCEYVRACPACCAAACPYCARTSFPPACCTFLLA